MWNDIPLDDLQCRSHRMIILFNVRGQVDKYTWWFIARGGPHFGELDVEMARKGGFAKQATVGSDLNPDNEVTATELQWPSLHNVCVVISLRIYKTASFQKEAMRTQVAFWFFMKWNLYRKVPLCLSKQNVWTHKLRKFFCFIRSWSERNDGFDCICL